MQLKYSYRSRFESVGLINSADFSSNQSAVVLTTIIGDKHSDPSSKLEVMTSGYGMLRKHPVASIFF